MSARVMPRVGASVSVRYLGATLAGVVERTDQEGRLVVVLTEDGEHLTFVLNQATAKFTVNGESWGARLSFTAEDAPDES